VRVCRGVVWFGELGFVFLFVCFFFVFVFVVLF